MAGTAWTASGRPTRLHPLRFEPIYKHLIWGGRRFASILGRPLGPEPDYAESWEVADHGDDVSRVAEGPLTGRSLSELLGEWPEELLGRAGGSGTSGVSRPQFPLLVKFLDAHRVLSVQVHPDDEQARRLVGDNGKTEAWVILHAEPGSVIYAGLRPGVAREALARGMAESRVEPLLHRFEPRAGDCVLIPAGTVHAIGPGIVLSEIQQMSDATFRIDDWGRLGADGRPRRLHQAESLEVIDFQRGPVDPVPPTVEPHGAGVRERLICCPYFRIDRHRIHGPIVLGRPDRFTILIVLEGAARFESEAGGFRLERGQSWLLPAELGSISLAPESGGTTTLLECWIP